MSEAQETIALPIRAGRFRMWAAGFAIIAIILWACVWFFGGMLLIALAVVATLATLKMLSRWLQSRGAEIRLSPKGFRDTRYMLEPVPWREVTDVQATASWRLSVTFSPDSPNRFGPGVRHWHDVSRKLSGTPGLQVSMQGVAMDAKALGELVKKYRERHRSESEQSL